MTTTKNIGNKGEQIAIKYLQQNGFNILHTNWQFGHKEIDIVAEKNNCLHIIEVKTRAPDFLLQPKDAVVRAKQRHLILATEAYIIKYNINCNTQFDIISIVLDGEKYEIEYIPEAFSPTL